MKGRFLFVTATGLLLGVGLFIAGCTSRDKSSAPQVKSGTHDAGEHEHAKGVLALGDYHARIVVEQGGTLKLFILGKDETKVASIQEQEVRGTLQAAGEAEAVPVVLMADRQPGDPPGKVSQFTAIVPESLRGKSLVADLSILIDNEPYRPKFPSVPGAGGDGGHGAHAGAPAGKDQELFLTPGGLYTAADIQANGGVTPAEKFKGMQFHMLQDGDADLKPGERICPVTNNRSDPKCSWIVNGKKYEFCCPPCLNKFVALAKKQPEKIKEPEAYVHKE